MFLAATAAEHLCQMLPGYVAGNLHATDNTSSRTRCKRILAGIGRSKKNAATASRTSRRSSSQESPCVKMFSVRHSAQYPPPGSCTTSKTSSSIHLYGTALSALSARPLPFRRPFLPMAMRAPANANSEIVPGSGVAVTPPRLKLSKARSVKVGIEVTT